MFLMRCLFTMFAEDVELLPEDVFTELLERCRDNPEAFVPLLGELWQAMNKGGFSAAHRAARCCKFNGDCSPTRRCCRSAARRSANLREAAEQGLARGRAGDLRHAAGTGARSERAQPARRALHAARLCRAAGGRDDHRAAARGLARRAGGGRDASARAGDTQRRGRRR